MLNVDIVKAENCLSELIAQSISGRDVVISRDGQPVVKLVALTGQKRKRRSQNPEPRTQNSELRTQNSELRALNSKRRFGSARGMIKISDDFDEPLEDFKDYM